MSEIRTALMRKFGPLPAWAWALIAGAAVYVYRARKTPGAPASLDANTPGISDNTPGLKDPLSLAPGESVYDPNTGQLVGTAPEQQPGAGPDPQTPITLEPGETLYDPNTHQLIGATKPGKSAKQKGKRAPKIKPHHKQPKAAKHPTHPHADHGGRHGKGKILKGHRVPGSGLFKPAKHSQPRASVSSAKTTGRTRAASPPKPAMRQRPAAPHVTHPTTQRRARHPARRHHGR